MTSYQRIEVIDSHTGGEPTRVVIAGGPDLGRGSHGRAAGTSFVERFDDFRSLVVNEPRGFRRRWSGPCSANRVDPDCVAGVIFFNNVGMLGMCGHGTIGLAVTLAHLGRIRAGNASAGNAGRRGRRRIRRWPIGSTFENVASFRHAHSVEVDAR